MTTEHRAVEDVSLARPGGAMSLDTDLARAARAHLEEMLASMRVRGFAGRVGFGERPGILVVDLIRGFTDARCPLAANLDAEVAATARVLDAARAVGAPIVLTTTAYEPPPADATVWQHKIPSNRWLVAGSEWTDVDPRLRTAADDQVLVKRHASCFFGTDLLSRLVTRAVDTLVITGCTTSGCVRASAVDACSAGLRTIVVEDAVGDRAPLSHLTSLFDIDAKYGDVVTADRVVDELRARR